MWFSILHRQRPAGLAAPEAPLSHRPIWSTCLREVFFQDAPLELSSAAAGDVLADADAYAFLLETICGLQSPIVGETQVLGQFRAFLATLSPDDASWLGGIGQQLLTDARVIRERHLRGLGTRSYGSAVRKYMDGIERVALVGAGALANDVLPYVAEGRVVDHWTRAVIAEGGGRPAAEGRAAIIVAAPVRAEQIAVVARCYPSLARVIDLRAAEERDAISGVGGTSGVELITLDDVFAAVDASTAATAARVARAREDIRRMASAFERRQLLRPFGWDDLCA